MTSDEGLKPEGAPEPVRQGILPVAFDQSCLSGLAELQARSLDAQMLNLGPAEPNGIGVNGRAFDVEDYQLPHLRPLAMARILGDGKPQRTRALTCSRAGWSAGR